MIGGILDEICTPSDTVVIHHIITRGTIDEQIMDALERKEKTQSALIDAVKAELKGGSR